MYAVRIINNRAYVVTYERMDPLYVIDLSDTADPLVLGELEIPGVSNYLHPIGDNLLLGIGLDGTDDVNSEWSGWFRGVKVALFDVTDPVNPVELKQYLIGDRGSHSQAQHNHKAVAFLKGNSERPHRLALPVSVSKVTDNGVYVCETHECTTNELGSYGFPEYGDRIHRGLYLFEISEEALHGENLLSWKGSVIDESSDKVYFASQERAVIQSSALHYVCENGLYSTPWAEPDNTNYLEFGSL